MKARIPPEYRLSRKVLDIACAEAKKQTDAQVNDICNRCTNEFYTAMHQAGLSVKTIMRVRNILAEVVIPKTEALRDESLKAPDECNPYGDGDLWMENYCKENGLPYEQVERRI